MENLYLQAIGFRYQSLLQRVCKVLWMQIVKSCTPAQARRALYPCSQG